MGDEDTPVKVRGGISGDSVNSYSVDHHSASLAADATETAIPAITTARTSMETALEAAEDALPSDFATAVARLKSLREAHSKDLTTISTYASGCVKSVRSCLSVYETTSAEQVAATQRYQGKLDFDHPGLFGLTQKGLNEEIDNGLGWPSSKPGTRNETSYEYSAQGPADDRTTTTSYERKVVGDGITRERSGYSTSHTSNGVTDTTTYTVASHRGGGVDTTYVQGGQQVTQDGREVSSTVSEPRLTLRRTPE